MARRASGNSIRLNLVVSPKVRERMLRLQEWADADSMSEVVRRSLAVYEVVLKADRSGANLVIRQPDGSEKRLIVIP